MGSLPKLCKYTWRWNSSANFLLVHWEWSSNEVYFMLTFCNGAFLSWMTHICTAAQHVFDLWIMLYFKTFYPVRITTVSHEPDWCNTFNSKAWLKPVYEAQNHIHQFNSCVSYTLFFLVMVALIVALKCVFSTVVWLQLLSGVAVVSIHHPPTGCSLLSPSGITEWHLVNPTVKICKATCGYFYCSLYNARVTVYMAVQKYTTKYFSEP